MPSRMMDFSALWASDKIAGCAEWAQAEYAWLYGLADGYGCFEITNTRVIWGRVAAIRKNLSLERLDQIFEEFHDKGLLFTWQEDGKRFGHWTGSDRAGRLPPKSLRKRYARLTPPIPRKELQEYESKFSHSRSSQVLTTSRRSLGRLGEGKDKPSSTSPSAPLEAFKAFYKAYPNKKAPARAQRAWNKILAEDVPAIMAGLDRLKGSEQWKRDNGRYVPHPATFLNDRRWEDEVPPLFSNSLAPPERPGTSKLTDEDVSTYRKHGVLVPGGEEDIP